MKAATAPITYYRDADFLVTSAKVKSPRKTYRVDKIEKVGVRRDPYYIMLAVTAFLALFLMRFGQVFSGTPAPWLMLYVCIILAYIAQRFALLFITSKAVSELAFIGLHDRLERVRSGIEKAMHREDLDDGMGADHGEDDED